MFFSPENPCILKISLLYIGHRRNIRYPFSPPLSIKKLMAGKVRGGDDFGIEHRPEALAV